MCAAAFVYDPTRPDFADTSAEVYRTLRDAHPLYYEPTRDVYAISRFEDVWNATSDTETFSSEGTSIGSNLLPTIQTLDPPRHNALRNLVSVAFTPRRMAEMEQRVRAIARELLDAALSGGHCDLMREYAAQLPSRVIGEMIGVPPERQEAFLGWTESMVETPTDTGDAERNVGAATLIYREFATLLEERRREPREDLMSALLAAELEGERLSQEELLGFCFVLIVAGNDTTANLIANGAVLLAHHPEQRALLVEDPARIPDAVEEMLRCESPAQTLPRRVTRDVTLHGVHVPAGKELYFVFAAANRDEREFAEPDRFDVTRRIKRHLAFGHGPHFCLGAKLARLEARVAFEELLARAPEYKLEAEPRWLVSQWARAYAGVPIRVEPR